MITLAKYYPPIKLSELYKYMEVFLPLVIYTQGLFGIDAQKFEIEGDHIGVQVLSPEGFDQMHESILKYAKLKKEGIIHNRRNNIYVFNETFKVGDFSFKGLEIFEPKPGADISKLKAGVEHVSFYSPKFEELYNFVIEQKIPIDKYIVDERGEKFFKTKLLNMIEIEYRNTFL